jgi:hypothetical protein
MELEPGSGGPRPTVAPAPGSVDVPLVLYALAAGVLAVSAGAIVAQAQRWGALTNAISLLTTATLTVVAGVAADSVLGWLIPADQDNDSSYL